MEEKKSLIIESHFGVPENYISPNTRNKSSEDLVAIINRIAIILYPDEEFEIYFLPSENGSYKDVLKIIGISPGIVVGIGGLALAYLTYKDSHEKHEHEKSIWVVEDEIKCATLKKELIKLEQNTEDILDISNDSIKAICGDVFLQKKKNNRARILRDDPLIINETSILKEENSKNFIFKRTLEKKSFEQCIEIIPGKEDYFRENLEGNIELISLVVKQKKSGQGKMWSGTYYGNDILERGIEILKNGEDVSFFMQDNDFKKQINNHSVSFKEGDNIKIIFNVKATLNIDYLENKTLYVTQIVKFNEDIIIHKEKRRNQKIIDSGQMSLLKF